MIDLINSTDNIIHREYQWIVHSYYMYFNKFDNELNPIRILLNRVHVDIYELETKT